MELRHLRYFLAVAEELHFARAAERLHIDQSPLSRAVKELQEELGARLFVRTTRSTQLTRAWRLFLELVPRVFASIEQARDSVRSAANGFHGQLRIALSDGITPSRLPALLAQCREEDPEVEVRLCEVPLAQQIRGLQDDLYDAGFSMAEHAGDGIVVTPAWEDELMVAVPARHPLLAFKKVPLEEVLRYPLTLGDPAVCEGHARQVDRFLRKLDQEPLTERPGLPARIIVNRDLVLRPTSRCSSTVELRNEHHQEAAAWASAQDRKRQADLCVPGQPESRPRPLRRAALAGVWRGGRCHDADPAHARGVHGSGSGIQEGR